MSNAAAMLRSSAEANELELRQQEWAAKKWAWLIDKREGCVAVSIVKEEGDKFTVQGVDGKEQVVSSEDIEPMNPPKFDKSEDMATLLHLNESSVLHNLRDRYQSNLIYTYSGLFLVVINPWRRLPLYTDEIVQMYRNKKRKEMPPHIFAVCDEAYRDMLENKENQSLLITGESGAGKTENTKKVIQYLATVAGTSGTTQNQLEKQILLTNPLLEAFGNAKTIRNNNSSRFGKFIRIEFGGDGKIVGCNIDNYLLEKSRVISHAPNERSFHIFYQLIEGSTAEQKAEYLLESSKSYNYLQGDTRIEGVDDAREFADTVDAMNIIGFSESEQDSIWRILSGILTFGNIAFQGSRREESANIKDVSVADKISHLFGVKSADFQRCLLKPRIKAGREWVTAMVTADKAQYNSDALVKAIYERLFKWIISKINSTLETHGRSQTFLGALDIAGFEIFEHNTFEQLCINLTNEKLQQFFNHHMFVLEQEEYVREGIEWKFVDFGLDLQPTIDLIEKPVGSIMSFLDEQCILPKATDKTFVEKIHEQLGDGKHPKYRKPRLNPEMFELDHYAGTVTYETKDWIDKNKDPINDNVATLFSKSTNALLAHLFEDFQANEDGTLMTERKGKASSFITVAQRHRQQLNALLTTLRSTSPNFVRCIIPNEQKKPGLINAPIVLDQLRCNGVLEGIRIVRMGFPNRIQFAEFKQRYEILCPGVIPKGFMDGRVASEKLLKALNISDEQYRIGHSKVFFKAGTVAELEERRDERLSQLIRGFQAAARGCLARRQFRRQHGKEEAILLIQKNARVFIELYQWNWWKLYRSVKPLLGVHRQEQQVKGLQAKIDELEAALKKEQETRKELETQIVPLERERDKLIDDLTTEREALEEVVASLKNTEEKRARLQTLLKDMESQLEEADEENARLDSTAKKQAADIKALQAELADNTKTLAAVEEIKKVKEEEIEQLTARFNSEKAAIQAEIDSLRRSRDQAVAEAKVQQESLQSTVERLRKELKSATAEKDDVAGSLDEAVNAQQIAEKARRELEAELATVKGELRASNVRRQQLEDQKIESDAQLTSLSQRIDEAEIARASYAQQKNNLEEELQEIRELLAEAQKQKGNADRANKAASAQLAEAEANLEKERARAKEAEAEKLALDAEVLNLNDKLAKAAAAADNSLHEALRAERAKNAALEAKIQSETTRRIAAEERYHQSLDSSKAADTKLREIREALLR